MSDLPPVRQAVTPKIGVRESDGFFRELRQTVISLEEAYRDARLEKVLAEHDLEGRIGSALVNCYRGLMRKPVLRDPEGRRLESVYALLDQTREELFKRDVWFLVENETSPASAIEADRAELPAATDPSGIDRGKRYRVIGTDGQPIDLRFDQLIAARSWGIGFYFQDSSLTDRLTELMVDRSVLHLARDLNDLAKLLPRVLSAEPGRYPPLVPPRSGFAFEQLVADILNETADRAGLSRLSEDYSQKTDLRVRYEGLGRKRGARVQVTLAASELDYQKKIDSIRRADQFVILSPWALACSIPQVLAVPSGRRSISMSDDLIARFWDCIPGDPPDSEALSYALQGVFRHAIRSPIEDPRGPMACVPEPLREFIRIWVHEEAVRSTRALRDWEGTDVRYRERADGRLVVWRTYETLPSRAVREFLEQNPEGTRVRGRVTEVGDRFARVALAGGLMGRIEADELTWGSRRVDPGRFLEIGQAVDLSVLRAARGDPVNEILLSLKRLLPDPWADNPIARFAIGSVVEGRVRDQAAFGLFVELERGLIGLLHRSELPPAEQPEMKTRYPLEAVLRIRILSVDPEARKISLGIADRTTAT